MSPVKDIDNPMELSRARALASPLRMRILRLCLHEAKTNKVLADELGMNPGSSLHHIRTLVNAGFLVAGAPRPGSRGAREVPYLATRSSWKAGGDDISSALLEAFLQEIEGLRPDQLHIVRLGVKLNGENREQLLARIQSVFEDYKNLPADADGEPISLMFVEHPETPRADRTSKGSVRRTLS